VQYLFIFCVIEKTSHMNQCSRNTIFHNQGFHANIFDRIWYEYEHAFNYKFKRELKKSGPYAIVGGDLPFVCLGFVVLCILCGFGLPFYIGFALLLLIIYIIDKYFDKKRCVAIVSHYGKGRNPMNSKVLFIIIVGLQFAGFFLYFYIRKYFN